MAEANRVVAKRKARGPAGELPVFAFVWPRYHSNHFDGHYAPDARTYLRGADMAAEFGRPALLHGAAGVLIWGMKDDVINDTQCNGPSSFGRWVNMTLGPYLLSVGARVAIGPGCRVGERTQLHANAVLYPGVEVGEDCRIYAGVVLREGSRLGDRVVLHSLAPSASIHNCSLSMTAKFWLAVQIPAAAPALCAIFAKR